MRKSSRIVGVAISQFHGDDENFEFLIAYEDGREIGKIVTRDVLRGIQQELTGLPLQTPEEMREENERLRADNRPADRATFHHPV